VLSRFAAVTEGIHISLSAEPLFELGPLTVTNAILYGIVCAIFMAYVLIRASKKINVKPIKSYGVSIIEMIIEYIIGVLSGAFGSREKAARFTPVFGFFFLFIIFTNLLGIIPLVGPGFSVGETPLFRPFTADLNGTIAMSVIAIVVVQYLSIKEQGGKKHIQHYFSDKPANPINFFIGILEVFGEFTRIISLSLRLFLNTAVGEILIAVFTSMILVNGRTPIAVIPILLFEVLVAYIQAYVFTVLAGTYLGMAISHANDSHHDDTVRDPMSPGTLPGESEYSKPSALPGASLHSTVHHSPATLTNQVVGHDG
jgi:F-type H+-transporting ATPase subunit a